MKQAKNEDRAAVSCRVDVAEILQYLQGGASALRTKVSEPAREPRSVMELGCSRGRSVQAAHPTTKRKSRADAEARLVPDEWRQLAKGAQENRPQHPDARSSPAQQFISGESPK